MMLSKFSIISYIFLLLFSVRAAPPMLTSDTLRTNFHWTDWLSKKHTTDIEPGRNDSNTYFNQQSIQKSKRISKNRENYIATQIEPGHTNRKEFIRLMDQRDQHEKHVSGAMTAGLVLHPSDRIMSTQMFIYAQRHRIKAQETQRQMNYVKASGYIDPNQAKIDKENLNIADGKDLAAERSKRHKTIIRMPSSTP